MCLVNHGGMLLIVESRVGRDSLAVHDHKFSRQIVTIWHRHAVIINGPNLNMRVRSFFLRYG